MPSSLSAHCLPRLASASKGRQGLSLATGKMPTMYCTCGYSCGMQAALEKHFAYVVKQGGSPDDHRLVDSEPLPPLRRKWAPEKPPMDAMHAPAAGDCNSEVSIAVSALSGATHFVTTVVGASGAAVYSAVVTTLAVPESSIELMDADTGEKLHSVDIPLSRLPERLTYVRRSVRDDGLTEEEFSGYTEAFASFDAHGAGILTHVELEPLLRHLGYNPTDAELQELWRSLDDDSGVYVDLPDFISVMALLRRNGLVQAL